MAETLKPQGALAALVAWSVRSRLLVLMATMGLAVAGVWALVGLPIDAFPDVTDVQVTVLVDAPGRAPDEVERLATRPLEAELAGMHRLIKLRSISKQGMANVTAIFEDACPMPYARQQVAERLAGALAALPAGVKAAMGPEATGMGEVYQYTLEGPQPLAARRMAHDLVVRPRLRMVPGVAEVNVLGGELEQMRVELDPWRLAAHGLGVPAIAEALTRQHGNAAGGVVVDGDRQLVVQGLGMLLKPADLASVVVAQATGDRPLRLGEVATVGYGMAPRQGAATRDGHETVAGIVLKRRGANTREVIQSLELSLPAVAKALPPGMKLVPYYDQRILVEQAIGTVEKALLEGGVLVIVVLSYFLWGLRASLLVASTIPLSLLLAFLAMRGVGLAGNLMSLGGLAIGLGMMADAGIVVVEQVHRRLAAAPRGSSGVGVVAQATAEVGRPVAFAIGIIVASFLPLLALEGIEGKTFAPMALAIAFAMVGALVLALTYVPAAAAFVLRPGESHRDPPGLGALGRAYDAARHGVAGAWPWALGAATLALMVALSLVPSLGSEFLPAMDEGSSVASASRDPATSLAKANAQAMKAENQLRNLPEVRSVVTRTGRAELATDPMDVGMSDVFVDLAPRAEWRSARSKDEMVAQLQAAVSGIPGYELAFGEPIAVRVDELVAGAKRDLVVKVMGEDLEALDQVAAQVESALRRVPGVADLRRDALQGLLVVRLRPDRAAMARHGVAMADLADLMELAIGRRDLLVAQDGPRRVGIALALPATWQGGPERLAQLPVPRLGGGTVALGELAQVALEDAPVVVGREDGLRRVAVEANVQGRDLGSFVAEAQKAVANQVPLPVGVSLVWGGQFENQRRAMARLGLIVPTVLAAIFVLLTMAFGSWARAALVFLNVPFAMVGGILALWLGAFPLSVPASVGFLALFGVAMQNGVLLVSAIEARRASGEGVSAAVHGASHERLRPVLMTALVAALGLLPLALAQGIGSEVQRPLAWVVMGGLGSATALTLLLLPALYLAAFDRRRPLLPRAESQPLLS